MFVAAAEIIIVTKLIESYVALLLTGQLLAEERQHFHDNLCE